MKQNLILIIICCFVQLSFAQKPKEYNIKRTTFIKGTYKTFTHELKKDSILVIRYSTNNREPKTLYSNVLNSDQKSKLTEILNGFNLTTMKSQYVNQNVDGEGHFVYDIKINHDFKSIYVYFGEEPNLKKLDEFFTEILPLNQDGWHDVY